MAGPAGGSGVSGSGRNEGGGGGGRNDSNRGTSSNLGTSSSDQKKSAAEQSRLNQARADLAQRTQQSLAGNEAARVANEAARQEQYGKYAATGGALLGGAVAGPIGAFAGKMAGPFFSSALNLGADPSATPGVNAQMYNQMNTGQLQQGNLSGQAGGFQSAPNRGQNTGQNLGQTPGGSDSRVGNLLAGAGGIAALSGGGGIGGIVNSQVSAQDQAINEQRQQQSLISGQLDPYRTTGTDALSQQRALLGLGGAEQQQAAFSAFGNSPGQKFLRDRQEKALLRNQAAIGGLGGGNVRTALQEQAAGIAQQDFNNQFGRLGQLSGQGLQATTAGGQFGAGTAANISNLQVGQGEARASGILAKEQRDAARTEGIANILGLFSDDISSGFSDLGTWAGDAWSNS